jgi:response regulator RpfG family c-di-GMP phosphodiesterase
LTFLTVSHTEKHAERLQDLAEALGKSIGLSEFKLNRLRLLALLHDIGKIGTPDNILFRQSKKQNQHRFQNWSSQTRLTQKDNQTKGPFLSLKLALIYFQF